MDTSEKTYSRKRIGEIFITKEGYNGTIIDGGSKKNYCTIQIDNWVTEVPVVHTVTGSIKYPFHPNVCTTGYVGVGEYTSKTHKKLYQTWKSMLERCYDKKLHLTRTKTYIGCTVHKDWHSLQVFGKWFEENYVNGYHLDKDLLLKNNKIYSAETCLFIPQKLNSFLGNNQQNNTSGYIGVQAAKSLQKPWKTFILINGKNTYLGCFTTKEKASKVYQEARAIEANKLKIMYKDAYPEQTITNIC